MESLLMQPTTEEPTEAEEKRPHLESITVQKKSFSYADKTLYRVYDTPSHFSLVEADSAAEAFEKSGLAEAHKIQRETYYHYVALSDDALADTDQVIKVDVELPSQAEKALFLEAALIDEAVAKSNQAFEGLGLSVYYGEPEAAQPTQPAATEQPTAPPQTPPAPDADAAAEAISTAEQAAQTEAQPQPAMANTDAATAAEQTPDSATNNTPEEALSAKEINALLAAQEGE